MKFLLISIFSVAFCSSSIAQTYIDFYNRGMEAYEQQNYKQFLKSFTKADSLRPNHRILLYNLAAAYALTNQPEKAYEVLSKRIKFYAVNDFNEDKDFSKLAESEYIQQLEENIENANSPNRRSIKAFEVDIIGFHAEGIEYEKETNRFYITDIRNGWIYSVDMNGNNLRQELDLKNFGYWSAMGIKLDPVTPNKLWVTTSALPNFTDYVDSLEGRSAILSFDLTTGKLLEVYKLEDEHVFGDLVIGKDGLLYISDSRQPNIYILNTKTGDLTKFISDENWWNLQGLALSSTGESLYVSDYVTGIHKVNLSTKKIEPISEMNEMLRGADGIYISGNKLYMLQNGSIPKRIASISLNESEVGISSSINYPDNALVELDEPTLGVVVGSHLYYIANSPWMHYDDANQPLLEKWKPTIINRLTLE
ncbi:MAG: hypothetical protein RLN90_10850 [Balneolaceae bacterium]